jgi:outer membrane protein
MVYRVVCLSLIGTLIFSSVAHAATPLSGALATAYDNNQRLAASKASLKATNEGYVQAKAGWFPTLSANASAGYLKQTSPTQFPGQKTSRSPKTMALEANQAIYRGGRTVAQTDAALSDIGRARAQFQDDEQQVLLSGVTAYMDVLKAMAVLQLNEKNVSVLQENMRATRTRFSVGDVTKTDVAQAEARFATATAQRINALGALDSAKATYEQVMGIAPDDLMAPDVKLTLPTTLQEALDVAAKENPSLRASYHSADTAEHLVRREKGSLLPEIGVGGSANTTKDNSIYGGREDTLQASARLTMPLFQGGADYSKVRQAKQEAARAKAALINQQRVTTEQTIRSWDAYQTAKAQIVSLQSAINAAEVALDGVQKESMVGSRTVLDVLNAEKELLDARVSLVGAERDKEVAAYTLLAAIGRLSARYLSLQVAYYDPETDLDAIRNKFFGFGDDVENSTKDTSEPASEDINEE